MQIQHYELILIREIDKLIEEFETLKISDLQHLREKIVELIRQNDRAALLYHLSAKELFGDPDIGKSV